MGVFICALEDNIRNLFIFYKKSKSNVLVLRLTALGGGVNFKWWLHQQQRQILRSMSLSYLPLIICILVL